MNFTVLILFIHKDAYYLHVVFWLLTVEEQEWLLIGCAGQRRQTSAKSAAGEIGRNLAASREETYRKCIGPIASFRHVPHRSVMIPLMFTATWYKV